MQPGGLLTYILILTVVGHEEDEQTWIELEALRKSNDQDERDFSDRYLYGSDLFGKPYKTPRIKALSASDLRIGDHCCLKGSGISSGLFITHHMIVVSFNIKDNSFDVIHFQPDESDKPRNQRSKGAVTNDTYVFYKEDVLLLPKKPSERKKLKLKTDELFLMLHDEEECHSPEDVVENARNWLNDSQYNFLTRNCEVMATACKVKSSSVRVTEAKQFQAGDSGILEGSFLSPIKDHFIVLSVKVIDGMSFIEMVRFGDRAARQKNKARIETFVFDPMKEEAREQTSSTWGSKYTLHKVLHAPRDCFHPDDVVQHAKQLVGEVKDIRRSCSSMDLAFSTILKNYPIPWKKDVHGGWQDDCKQPTNLGCDYSDQTAHLAQHGGESVSRAGLRAAGEGVALGVGKAVARGAVQTLDDVATIATGSGARAAFSSTAIAGQVTGGVMVAGVEGACTAIDIYKSTKLWKEGPRKSHRKEFKVAIAKRLTNGATKIGCSIGGAVLGQILIPVPVLGGIVGGLVGTIMMALLQTRKPQNHMNTQILIMKLSKTSSVLRSSTAYYIVADTQALNVHVLIYVHSFLLIMATLLHLTNI